MLEFSVSTTNPFDPGKSRLDSVALFDVKFSLVSLNVHARALEFPVAQTQVTVVSPGHRNCLSQVIEVAAVKRLN